MSDGPANTLWARAFADELGRAGVREVALAPGSRSTPLVLAFARDGRFRLRVHLDERSAAFFALGASKASDMPAVMVTTSGTAAANVFPAVVEASESETPLLILTADRPAHLRDADANQTTDQVRMYGSFVRAAHDLARPVLEDVPLRHLRALACRSLAACVGPPAGPVHLNVPFDKPLEPVDPPEDFVAAHPLAASGRPDGSPYVAVTRGRRAPSESELDALADAIASAEGVIVAGPHPEPERVGPAVRALAARTGLPLLADPLSGARHGSDDDARAVPAYDLILRSAKAAERLAPSVVLRVGSSPTSAPLQAWLARHAGTPQIVVDGGGRWKDHGATATSYVRGDAANTLRALAGRAERTGSPEWAELWRRAGAAAVDTLADEAHGAPHEGGVWTAVGAALPAGGSLFVSSSMPVRDLDAFGRPRPEPMRVFANRGVSGIDGIVSTAFGVASACEGPTVCVVGDLAFFHDQNGLLWSRESDAPVVFVLVDNDGGGIFHTLPVAEHEPYFTDYVATPHGLDLAHAARMHGIGLRDVTVPELLPALERALQASATTVLRLRIERVAGHRRRAEVIERVSRSVGEALG